MFNIESVIQQYGAVAVFFGTLLEGEVALLTGAVAAGNGLLVPAHVFLLAWAGSFFGDQASFHFARHAKGFALRRKTERPETVGNALEKIENNDIAYILTLRFMVGCRTIGLFAAGFSSLRAWRFFYLSVLATFIWTCTIFTVGYIGGKVVLQLFKDTPVALFIVAGIAVVALVWFLRARFAKS
ncbi:MAG: DedA family protein [Hyphomicrobiales bacterium]|nr:DedA family protein [Hyphomicrobiales bacterium]